MNYSSLKREPIKVCRKAAEYGNKVTESTLKMNKSYILNQFLNYLITEKKQWEHEEIQRIFHIENDNRVWLRRKETQCFYVGHKCHEHRIKDKQKSML